jgi:hypothetical protein
MGRKKRPISRSRDRRSAQQHPRASPVRRGRCVGRHLQPRREQPSANADPARPRTGGAPEVLRRPRDRSGRPVRPDRVRPQACVLRHRSHLLRIAPHQESSRSGPARAEPASAALVAMMPQIVTSIVNSRVSRGGSFSQGRCCSKRSVTWPAFRAESPNTWSGLSPGFSERASESSSVTAIASSSPSVSTVHW